MEMTLDEYINNPMGRKNAVFSNREMYRAMYADKLDKLYLRENGNIGFTVYKDKKGYFIHFKIPSESTEGIYYDTVFQFYTSDTKVELEDNIHNYKVKFFSNDPAFVYTFAYAFMQKDLFIKDLNSRLSKYTRKTPAFERNPENQINYVKSFYFAYLVMLNKNMFLKVRLDSVAEDYSKTKLLSDVMDSDAKIEQINQGKKDKKKQKKAPELPDENQSNEDSNVKTISKSKQTNRIKKTGTVKRVGTVKTVGKVKKI